MSKPVIFSISELCSANGVRMGFTQSLALHYQIQLMSVDFVIHQLDLVIPLWCNAKLRENPIPPPFALQSSDIENITGLDIHDRLDIV